MADARQGGANAVSATATVAHPTKSAEQSGGGDGHQLEPVAVDFLSPQLTLRAVLTGMVLGGILCACNIYAGLKIGWGFNMSVTAALLSFGFWNGLHSLTNKRVRHWGVLENNINQTACSSGASVSSAGLVAPIPALAMLYPDQTLDWHFLALWCFSVMLVGITVAIPLRQQMIMGEKLPFAFGIAAAETLKEMYAKGSEALARVRNLVIAALLAVGIKLADHFKYLAAYGLPFSLDTFSANALTFSLRPSVMLVGVGALIGFRACVSLLLGALIAYLALGPMLIRNGGVRLTVQEPLPMLPETVAFSSEDGSYAAYLPERHLLQWRGVMTEAERDELLARSDEPLYQEAVRKLYLRSQLDLGAPLGALPAGVSLAETPLHFDAEAGRLIIKGAVDGKVFADLAAKSDSGDWQQSLAALRDRLDITTTRYVQLSETVDPLPSKDFALPKEYTGVVKFVRAEKKLVLLGKLTAEIRAALDAEIDRYLETHPNRTEAAEAMHGALASLAARQDQPHLPAGVTIPASLAGVVTYDPERYTLQARGVLSPEQAAALRGIVPESGTSAASDLKATVERVIAGATFARANPGYGDLNKWLLWPGVTLMVISSLVSVAFSWRSFLAIFLPKRKVAGDAEGAAAADDGSVPQKWFMIALVGALILSVILQVGLFAIVWWAAVVGVLLTLVLALVAARVSGETAITPVGAMGKVTQLVFGVITPKDAAANLMAANVTGGASSQAGDLLHDLKCGYLLGAVARWQTLAQIAGAFAGAMCGAAFYLILIPNPGQMLMTDEWAAPAVAAWKAVAELFMVGLDAMPKHAPLGIAIATAVGVVLPVLEKTLPKKAKWLVPSAASVGLGIVIQAHSTLAMFTGGLLALILSKVVPTWSGRFLVAISAGLIAGESLTGVGIALEQAIAGILAG